MLTLGPLAFAAPWLLAALAALPAVWLVIRLIPPSPRLQRLPALQLLLGLDAREETAARTPWWLIVLRLLLAILIIVGLAQPLLNPASRPAGSGPVLLLLDDGWGAGNGWQAKKDFLLERLDAAAREGRTAALLTTARAAGDEAPSLFGPRQPSEIREKLLGLEPKPWPADPAAALTALTNFRPDEIVPAYVAADGLEAAGWLPLLTRLEVLGPVTLLTPPDHDLPMLLLPPENGPQALRLTVRRAISGAPDAVAVRAMGPEGRLLARPVLIFPAEAREASYDLVLPAEARNSLLRLELEGQTQAGAVVLADEQWRRRPVGVVSAGALDQSQSLLQDGFYLERALAPFAELRRGPAAELLKTPPSILLLADSEPLSPETRAALADYVGKGGVLVRFAGPRLAAEGEDTLLPVRLRGGDRALGTALQWTEPEPLAPFPAASPFAGLAVPKDVTVSRQVLAEPDASLADRSWAQLADGTPLVTGAKSGEGWLVLFHVPASAEWSNLPLSGLFVEMLQKLVALGRGQSGSSGALALSPLETLDGLGRSGPASASALPIYAGSNPIVGPRQPPGLYGSTLSREALNLTRTTVTSISALTSVPDGVIRQNSAKDAEIPLQPLLLTAALLLLLADLLVALSVRGLLRPAGVAAKAGRLAVLMLLTGFALLSQPSATSAQNSPDELDFALKAVLETRLAYVLTGDSAVDETSAQGLSGLSLVLSRRTAIEAAEPMAVDVESDELSFFPLLYWPVTTSQPPLTASAVEKINAYLRTGGTIVFDTRDGDTADLGPGAGTRRLRQMLNGIDVPPLMPADADHVMGKAFYLLQDFPGREAGGQLWVQAPGTGTDEVSSIILGSNDYAAAWALDPQGRPLHTVIPGGERQREMAFRVGVNLVMYALTGNYKADQVHVPAILERLGQ